MPAPSNAGNAVFGKIIKAKTAAYTVLNTEDGVLFTNRGATAAINFTLPDTSNGLLPIGFSVAFFGISATGFTVTCNPSDKIVTKNDAAADSITCTTTSLIIGAAVRVIWDGLAWLEYSESSGPTYAIAT
jgi:hypothetical protein